MASVGRSVWLNEGGELLSTKWPSARFLTSRSRFIFLLLTVCFTLKLTNDSKEVEKTKWLTLLPSPSRSFELIPLPHHRVVDTIAFLFAFQVVNLS